MVHDDVHLVSRLKAGAVVQGRADVTQFLHETVATRLYGASADIYTPLDDAHVVVEGRMRWIDEDRVIRDDPVVWAMEFRDGLLLRFVPARTVIEAEAILTSQQ